MTGPDANNEFDPILLDLGDVKDYTVVLSALEEYAAHQDGAAADEQDRITSNNLPDADSDEGHYRDLATRAQRIAADIERQMDANAAARQAGNAQGD